MSDLLLTIGIPTYNRVDCLRENLENLLPAFYPFAAEVEVLISDNASTDTTTQIIHQAMETYPFVRTQRHQNNLGLDANFFSLIPAARGKFLWLLCDDDQIRVSEIPRLLNLLRFPGEIKTVFLNYALYDQHLKICEKKQGVPLEKDCQMAGPDLFRVLNDELLRASCLVVRKNEIDRTPLARDYGRGYWCAPLVMAAESLATGQGLALSEPVIWYRGGNITWSKWWPLIAAFFSPSIIHEAAKQKLHQSAASIAARDKFATSLPGLLIHLKSQSDPELRRRFSEVQMFLLYATRPWFWKKSIWILLLPRWTWRKLSRLKKTLSRPKK